MRKTILTMILSLLAVSLIAQPISEQEALAKARHFFQGQSVERALPVLTRAGAESPSFGHLYLFNVEGDGGFVIVAGDSRAREILGYSREGRLDVSQMPANMQWWLSQYDAQIASIPADATVQESVTRADDNKPDVAMLMSYSWSQLYPYNSYCPQGCVSGCVATAMAQMMGYHKYPETLPAITGYTDSNGHVFEALQNYYMDYSDLTGNYAAALVRYCGQALRTNYGNEASSASSQDVAPVLARTFGYDAGVHSVYRDAYNAYAWDDLLYNELKNGRPFILSGSQDHNINEGHTFICHGYSQGYYAVNWGWGGIDNGYFAMSALTTSSQWYNSELNACIGICPPAGGQPNYPAYSIATMANTGSSVVSRASAASAFTISISWKIKGSFLDPTQFDTALALIKPNGKVDLLQQYTSQIYNPHDIVSNSTTVSLGAQYGDGTYQIVLIYKKPSETSWHHCQGYEWRYVQAVISGNMLTLTNYPVTDDPYPVGPYPPYHPITPDEPDEPDDPDDPDDPDYDEPNASIAFSPANVRYEGEYLAIETKDGALTRLIQNELGMSQDTFDENYWADCVYDYDEEPVPAEDAGFVTPYAYNYNYNNQFDENWYDMKVYNFGTDIYGTGGVPPAKGGAEIADDYSALIIYAPSRGGKGQHALSYETAVYDIENLIADRQSPITLTRWARFAAKERADGSIAGPYRFIWVSLSMQISWGDDPSGITTVSSSLPDGCYYDLRGQRMGRRPHQKGIYILNGRKVVVR